MNIGGVFGKNADRPISDDEWDKVGVPKEEAKE